MNTKISIIFIFFILTILLTNCISRNNKLPINNVNQVQKPSESLEIENEQSYILANDIIKDYLRDPIQADKLYKGNVYIIKGIIEEIEETGRKVSGSSFFLLGQGIEIVEKNLIHCEFTDGIQFFWGSKFNPFPTIGRMITIKGKIEGYTITIEKNNAKFITIYLTNCEMMDWLYHHGISPTDPSDW